MTISYNWLSEYLPEKIDPEELGRILTSIGLEVESLEKFEEVKGGMEGLITGEILECYRHPGADKLSIASVNTGSGPALKIVCGAPNVAAGQKVVVGPVGTTIYPLNGAPVTMKKARIRGEDSEGMICAADEIGLNNDHSGILVLDPGTRPGTPASEYFGLYTDHIFEIGLTPNRMDAMSHIGVAKDVCAWLSHHHKKELQVRSPFTNDFKPDNNELQMEIIIRNEQDCQRYCGVSIQGVNISESPLWLQQRLKSIGLRPINNIVDITNFILHETGQPLHAFDADKISGRTIIVGNLPEGTPFTTLDEKERKLSAADLMINDAEKPMCIAGVYGGLNTGVSKESKNIFLESAWFNPVTIRRTSMRHGLRTDAAARFEKGVDISNTANVLRRAAIMIREIAGGTIASDVSDIYPHPKPKTELTMAYRYLKKLSGKDYPAESVKNILTALGFDVIRQDVDEIRVASPYSKPDISLPADIVEEIMRIDGFDNVEIPAAIMIAPSVETLGHEAAYREKIAAALAGIGFHEIFTNSITNTAYYDETVLTKTVKMINSLSAGLNAMRPAMMETGLETVAYNCNRRNNDLKLFEFGKTYHTSGPGVYEEENHLSVYITGKKQGEGWKVKADDADLYFAKGLLEKTVALLGLQITGYSTCSDEKLDNGMQALAGGQALATLGSINKRTLERFDIKQPVFFIDIDWDTAMRLNQANKITYAELPRFPAASRDLSIIVDKGLRYEAIEKCTFEISIGKLKSMNLFDVFESEKLGKDKKSLAVSFTFLDEEKTMTDKDIDAMMAKIITAYEKELNAEIRK